MTTATSPLASKPQSEPAMTPQEYLAAADAALAADQPLECSRLLWRAGEATFIRLAWAHGIPGDDLDALARALDEKGGCQRYYLGKLGTATGLMLNANIDFLEPYELELSRESIHRFIKEMS